MHLLGHLQRKTFAGGGSHDGGGDDMLRCLLQRPGKPQHLVGVFVRRGLNGDETGSADSQGACLVEQNGMRLGPRHRGARRP